MKKLEEEQKKHQNIDKEKILKLSVDLETNKEILLNVIDRICYLILSNKMNSIEWKKEYGEIIHDMYTRFDLRKEERYNNIKKVEELWAIQNEYKYRISLNIITQNKTKTLEFLKKRK